MFSGNDNNKKLVACGVVAAAGASAQAAIVSSSSTITATSGSDSTHYADVDLNPAAANGREFTLVADTTGETNPGYFLKNFSNGFHYMNTGPNTGIAPLAAGTVVGPSSSFGNDQDNSDHYFNRQGTGDVVNRFAIDDSTQYFGFEFTNNGITNYGYASIQLDPYTATSNSGNARITGFAYDDSGAAIAVPSVPEPASLSLLALGAAGVLTRRKRA